MYFKKLSKMFPQVALSTHIDWSRLCKVSFATTKSLQII